MNLNKYFIFRIKVILIILLPSSVFSQFLVNPSFEDDLMDGYPLYGWSTCNSDDTPDSQPGYLGVSLPASDGISYLGLVMRGTEGPNIPKNENIVTKLSAPLEIGKTYQLKLDMAAATYIVESHDGLTVSYSSEPKLKIWGGETKCSESELLWESDLISNTTWETFNFEINPMNNNINSLKFEIYLSPLKAAYLLIDNIILEDILQDNDPDDPTVPEDTLQTDNGILFIPNVITPNGDGRNDVFKIDGINKNTVLKIFDRWGKLEYENSNYDNSWDGTDMNGEPLNSGNFIYILEILDSGIKKGNVFIKRE